MEDGVEAEEEEDDDEGDGAIDEGRLARPDAADFTAEGGEFNALFLGAIPGALAAQEDGIVLEGVVEADDFPTAIESG